MSSATTPASQSVGLSTEEIKRPASISLAGDLIERGIKSCLNDLHIILLQILDAGLVDSEEELLFELKNICALADALVEQADKTYPKSRYGAASHLIRREGLTLQQEVEIYRQEQFWTTEDGATLTGSESLIAEIFSFYGRVEYFMRQVDSCNPDTFPNRRHGAPRLTPNPYTASMVFTLVA